MGTAYNKNRLLRKPSPEFRKGKDVLPPRWEVLNDNLHRMLVQYNV